ncbi:MAG TPA: trypsin-like serine protease [Steroidobacteraceae bacterium]|nr:trypsin-like serine protease [Steroidobacteraceae bacterium]
MSGVSGAPAPRAFVVRTDLGPLIRAAADSPVQFAVPVPHTASTLSSGSWSVAGGEATWSYVVQVPTAVSLSFHALAPSLPEGATLLVSGGRTTTSYRASDLRRGELWSRIHPGDTLAISLTVAAADRAAVDLRIVSLQAGYRAIGAGVGDHPVYKRRFLGSSDNASCVSNYECEVTAGNATAAAATVALVVENLYQCTGTLINDVPGDNTPYVLTARHCETGQLGGGNPAAAAAVTVYWNATSACGTPLGSIYDGTLASQTGARTVIEQQDAWLIQLDTDPVVADAQFAGFDASGGAVAGGYTIHQAQGRDKQFVSWSGTAFALEERDALGTAYVSNLLETVNQTGNIGPGASGSGLFDRDNHLVGALALGRKSTDPSGYGACPVTPPPAPNGSNGVADFSSLAALWASSVDTTSSTGGVTLQSVLDPGNTGSLVVPGKPVENVAYNTPPPPAPQITFSPATVTAGQSFTAGWSATHAANCTLTGGIPGGSWGGSGESLPPSGSMTESGPAGHYTFGLICQSVEPNSLPVSTQATLTITPETTALAASPATEPAAAGGDTGSGGGGSMGVLEGAILAALLGFSLLWTTPRGRRWLMRMQPSPVRRRLRQQERTPRRF